MLDKPWHKKVVTEQRVDGTKEIRIQRCSKEGYVPKNVSGCYRPSPHVMEEGIQSGVFKEWVLPDFRQIRQSDCDRNGRQTQEKPLFPLCEGVSRPHRRRKCVPRRSQDGGNIKNASHTWTVPCTACPGARLHSLLFHVERDTFQSTR